MRPVTAAGPPPLEPHVWPSGAALDDAGVLHLSGLDVRALAGRHGTPAWLVDEDDLRARARAWRAAFPAHRADVWYATKAFLTVALARWVLEEGLGLDVASGGELAVAVAAGAPGERLLLHGNNKSVAELEAAVDAGVRVVVLDCAEEVTRLAAVAAARGVRQSVYVRVAPGVEAHVHEYVATATEDQKFGLGIEDGAAEAVVDAVLAEPALELRGLHCHVGSHVVDLLGFEAAVDRMVGLLARLRDERGLELPELDLGGGLGIAYTAKDEELPAGEFAAGLTAAVGKACADAGLAVPRLGVEPGRAVAGPSTVTLYEVGVVKDRAGLRRYVSVDGGMSDAPRTPLYGSTYTARLADRRGAEEQVLCRVVGKHCESGDVVVRDVHLPADVRAGDLLAVPGGGAYHHSMASNYNRLPRPPVVALRDGESRVLVRRETHEDLLRLEVGTP